MADDVAGTDWSSAELDAIVTDYFAMLREEQAGQRYNKAAHRRLMGIAFQSGALFDSLTVEQNVGFPLKEQRNKPNDRSDKLKAVLSQEFDDAGFKLFHRGSVFMVNRLSRVATRSPRRKNPR